MNSTDLRVLESCSGRLVDKLKESNSDEYAGLREAVQGIILVLESPVAQQAKDPLPRWLADHLPKIGLADDALILQHVVERNQGGYTAVWPNVSMSPQATAAITEITKQGLGITPSRARDQQLFSRSRNY